MDFEGFSYEDIRQRFTEIISKAATSNPYKFALARFLLDYSRDNTNTQVRYSEIAEYFFKYYWLQECKSRLRQGPMNQVPRIITIIRKEFKEKSYPESFKKLQEKERGRIERCVAEITKECFDDVIPRFQKIGGQEQRAFYSYFAKDYNDSAGNKKVDPNGGILLNENALQFFRDNYACLYKSVILEWIRFLEKRNFGTPNLVKKIEGNIMGARDQAKFRKHLQSFSDDICFYCENPLLAGRLTHVDHVIPFDYVGDTELWNLVLACQKCNCEKLGRLPPNKFIKELQIRNDTTQDQKLRESQDRLPYGSSDIDRHYKNAKRHGYPILANFPNWMY